MPKIKFLLADGAELAVEAAERPHLDGNRT